MYKFIDSMHQDYEDYYSFVYITLDQKHNKIYVGQRKGKTYTKANIEYVGSGTIIQRIKKDRGTYFLKKRILGVCYSAEELTEQETECKHFFNALNPLYGYNILEKDTYGDTFTNHPNKEEIRKKMSLAASGINHRNFGKHLDLVTIEKIRNSNSGLKRTEETCINISISKKGKVAWNKGKKDYMSEETLDKMSRAKLGKPSWNKGKKLSETHIVNLKISHTGITTAKYRSDIDLDDVRNLLELGWSLKKISIKYNCSRPTISNHLKQGR